MQKESVRLQTCTYGAVMPGHSGLGLHDGAAPYAGIARALAWGVDRARVRQGEQDRRTLQTRAASSRQRRWTSRNHVVVLCKRVREMFSRLFYRRQPLSNQTSRQST